MARHTLEELTAAALARDACLIAMFIGLMLLLAALVVAS